MFLFTDIENSTQLWEKYPEAMKEVLAQHNQISKEVIEAHGGELVKTTGDGVFAVFENQSAIAAAIDLQQAMKQTLWPEIGGLNIRLGMNAGEGEKFGGDYYGPDVNRAARVMSSAWGEQIILTAEATDCSTIPDECEIKDLGVHLLKDLAEPVSLMMVVHPDLRKNFPAPRTLSARPNNLPLQLSPFIGRQQELGEIQELLNNNCRLVTVLGPGGMGKTRLGLQAAAEHIDRYKDGVYFVSLAPISNGADIVSAVAEALNYSFNQQGEPKSQLLDYLSKKEMLLVMDNFEHVIDGAGLVGEIVQQARQVQVIATSRSWLNLSAECVFEISGMQIPETESDEVFEAFEAVELFISYAQRVKPDYHLEEEDRQAVVELCRLVGGMPLAIELATAWVRMLNPAEIVAELSKDLDFLAAERVDMPERQRSMRAVFDYSWKLLTEQEQLALRRLAVFRGGFSRHAGQAVSKANLRSLGSLVDNSLVKWRPSIERYEIHELIRQFAEQALIEAGAEEEIRAVHSDYYLRFLAEQVTGLKGKRQVEALSEISLDFDNIKNAWYWAALRGHWANLSGAMESLSLYLTMHTRPGERESMFGELTLLLRESQDKGEQLTWAKAKCFIQKLSGKIAQDIDLSRLEMDKALKTLELYGSNKEMALGFQGACFLESTHWDWGKAVDYIEKAIEIVQELDDPFYVGHMTRVSGYCKAWFDQTNFNPYMDGHQKQFEISKEIGDLFGAGLAAQNLGYGYSFRWYNFEEGLDKALYYSQLAIKYAEQTNSGHLLGHSYELLGLTYLFLGDLNEADSALEKAEQIDRDNNNVHSLAYTLGTRAIVEGIKENYRAANRYADEAVTMKSNPSGEILALWGQIIAKIGIGEASATKPLLAKMMGNDLTATDEFVLYVTPCAMAIFIDERNEELAVELLSLALNHPLNFKEWLYLWPETRRLEKKLKDSISEEVYQNHWERGKSLTLKKARELLIVS